MPMTQYLRKKIGDHAIGKASYTMPTMYMGLFTTNPTDSGSQAGEITGTGYARIEATSRFAAFDSVTGIAANSATFDYGSPGSDWGTIAYVGYLDAGSGGNMLYFEAIPSPRSAPSGSRPVRFDAGRNTIRHI